MKKIAKKISLFFVFILISIFIFSCSSSRNAGVDEDTQVVNLGVGINSTEDDYAFKQSHGGENAFLTSNRKSNTKISDEDDIWIIPRENNVWGTPRNAGNTLNVENKDNPTGDGACTISLDGRTLYFASSREGGFGNVDIYTAILDVGQWDVKNINRAFKNHPHEFEHSQWIDVKNLGAPINTKWFESHPSISPDNKTLYFVSNRPGGYGKSDIWYSELGEDGLWGEPINMGPNVNTAENESSPFIAADNSTLYFSSNGLRGYGEHDLFVVYKENGKWDKPVNLGPRVNGAYNDRFPYVPISGQTIYFSSDRKGGYGKYDVYVAIPNPKPPQKVTTISGIVSAAPDNQPMQVKIKVVEVDSRESIDLVSEIGTGKYFSIIPNGKKYEISVNLEGYVPYSQVIEVPDRDSGAEIVHNILLNEIVYNLNIIISHVLPSSEIIETDPMLVGFKGLLQKEVIVNGSFPLLPYIFFDKESSQIPSRYKQFQYGYDTKSFRENNLGHQLMQYYHILNIVGSRMKARPDARITLVGCNDNLGSEKDNIELSMSRANAIKRYLVYAWDIERHRVKVTARNLPIIPSSQTIAEGQAENRRVEIVVDAGTLLEPIYVEKNELLATPEKVDFNINAISDKPMKSWTFNITQNGKVLKQFVGNKTGRNTVSWNWLNDNNLLPQNDKPIHYLGVIYTTDGDSAVSRFSEIPVKEVILTSSSAEQQIGNKVFEKMTLLWYDFNNANLSPHNTEILTTIFPKITPDVRVSVDGHTDIIGSDATNLSLSRNRAKAVHDILKKNSRAKNYKYQGFGKTNPLYDNLLPEGRFYNRSVQVTIEKDVK